MKANLQKGFSLIELMVVISIIGILATIAIPAYHDYLVRSRISELINMGSMAKIAVTEYRLSMGSFPTSNALAGLGSISTKYISSLEVGDLGLITITGKATTLGTKAPFAIVLTPTFSNGAITWACSAKGATQYAPASCRSE